MDISIDIETMGSQDDALIFQIGAVAFDIDEELEAHELLQRERECLNIRIDVDHEDSKQFTVNESNIRFWRGPELKPAWDSIQAVPAVSPEGAIKLLNEFVGEHLGNHATIWALPPGFDLRILRGFYGQLGFVTPWHYRNEGCVRTLRNTARRLRGQHWKSPDVSGVGLIEHNALHDAVEQAVIVQSAMGSMRWATRKDAPRMH